MECIGSIISTQNPELALCDIGGKVNPDRAVDERSVYICDSDNESAAIAKLILETFNILEQLVALILQTLRRKSLQAFLPDYAIAPTAGRHLNVALPLMQSFGSSTASKDDMLDEIPRSTDITQAGITLRYSYE
ncbi:hypothetical protein MMC10_001701 [Thelotrema lepadinum]|nr:hypothetical protein [Thelotrema lepadinum]